jgi:hypothetical protein
MGLLLKEKLKIRDPTSDPAGSGHTKHEQEQRYSKSEYCGHGGQEDLSILLFAQTLKKGRRG